MIETNNPAATLWPHSFRHAIRSIYGLFLLLTLVGCASGGRQASEPPPAQGDARSASDIQLREDIMEAVFRHMCRPAAVENDIRHPVTRDHKVYFISTSSWGDPRPAFLKRLNDLSAPVKPIAAAEWSGGFIYDRETRERGAAFYIKNATLHSTDEADVDAIIHPGGSGKSCGWFYHLNRKDGKWVVTRETWKWMS